MPSRRRLREQALQVLFSWDARKRPDAQEQFGIEEALSGYYDGIYSEDSDTPRARDEFVERLARTASARVEEIDKRISSHAEHWRLERMPAVDRNLLRLAIAEMITEGTPAPVVIDESLELARRFAGEDSVHFINAVLDAVRKELGAG